MRQYPIALMLISSVYVKISGVPLFRLDRVLHEENVTGGSADGRKQLPEADFEIKHCQLTVAFRYSEQ